MATKEGCVTSLLNGVLGLVAEVIVDSEKDSSAEKIAEGEVLVGIMDVQTKQLMVLWRRGQLEAAGQQNAITAKSLHLMADQIGVNGKPDQKAITAALVEDTQHLYVLKNRNDFYDSLFWQALRLQFPELQGNSIGLRENWQVVALKSEKSDDSSNFEAGGVTVIPVALTSTQS